MPSARTRVRWDWTDNLMGLLLLLAGLALVPLAFLVHRWLTFGLSTRTYAGSPRTFSDSLSLFSWEEVVVVCGFALFLIVAGYFGLQERDYWAPCPVCKYGVRGLRSWNNADVPCPGCHTYLGGERGWLSVVDPETVRETPTYQTVLAEPVVFPPACCVCSGSECESVPVTFSYDEQRQPGDPIVRIDTTLQVPHCAEHWGTPGVKVEVQGAQRCIGFRSLPYLRAFCERNGTVVGAGRRIA